MMPSLVCAILLAVPGVLFDVQSFPAPAGARFFLAPLDAAGGADLVVLHDHGLTVYADGQPAGARELALPPETSALDVFDLDGDAVSEVIAVAGDRILTWSFERGESPPEPVELFRLHTQLAGCGPAPFLYVLGIEWAGRAVLGLPLETAFELRDAAGAFVASFPLTTEAPHRASYGRPFTVDTINPPVIGPRDALEMDIRRSIEIEPSLPRELAASDKHSLLARRSLPPRTAETAGNNPAYWPWFALLAKHSTAVAPQDLAQWDVLYSLADEDSGTSCIRFRMPGNSPKGAPRIGPERRFAGAVLNAPDRLPDFDGDGFVDLAVWMREERLPAANALARLAATGRASWRLVVHLFDARKRRFEPASTAHIVIDAPVAWLVNAAAGPPAHLVLFEDFDADGHTDFGCATDADEFSVWRWDGAGIERTPVFQMRFPESLREVAFHSSREPGAGVTVGLRGSDSLFLLGPVR